jgi:hypothetical protein
MLRSTRPLILAAVAGALAGAVVDAAAATVMLTNCAAAPVKTQGSKTVVDVRPDDLVIACALAPLPGTDAILVRANKITVAGPAGGVTANGKGRSIELRADADMTLTSASLDAANGNAKMRLVSETGFTITGTILNVGDATRAGRELRIECDGSGCPLSLSSSDLRANRIRILTDGPISGDLSTATTSGPRDRISIRSLKGAVNFCKVNLLGRNEGNIEVIAFGDVNLTGSELATGRYIDVRAGLGGTGNAILTSATLRNNFGKDGEITVTAAGGAGQIDIAGATLIDDDKPVTINDVSTLNGRQQTPHQGFNNTAGVPGLDT